MSYNSLDHNGQPINRNFNRKRREDRSIDELIGISKGVIADYIVNQAEAEFILSWIKRNSEIKNTWPVNVLFDRITEMLSDNYLDQEEQAELFELIHQFTGQNKPAEILENWSSTLPLDQPMPEINFEDRVFCFTGKFVSGSRKDCQRVIEEKGGIFVKGPSRKLDYLVIGVLGSEDWIHTSYGRKIERAMELKNQGFELSIVSEDHWVDFAYVE